MLPWYLWFGGAAATPVTDRKWLAVYPDRVVRARPRDTRPSFMVEPILPIPRPAPPTDLDWLTIYPDRPVRSCVQTQPSGGQNLLPPGVALPDSDLRWAPIYPGPLRRLRRPAISQLVAPLGVQTAIAQTLHWTPIFPDHFPAQLRARRRPGSPGLTAVFPPDLYGTPDSGICIEWADEAIVLPQMTAEVITLPAITEETLISGTLAEETLC